jgi:serine/threonine protein kinase
VVVQEYCNGGSLRTAILQGALRPPSAGGIKQRWRPLMHVAKSIAEGMGYLHSQRILHGDLNPANILLKVRSSLVSFCIFLYLN